MTGRARLVDDVDRNNAAGVINQAVGNDAGGDVAIDGAAVGGGGQRIDFTSWHWNSDESKRPMSVELLKKICGWLLDYGTPDGPFAHCYLLLTWNLCCRSNNTA